MDMKYQNSLNQYLQSIFSETSIQSPVGECARQPRIASTRAKLLVFAQSSIVPSSSRAETSARQPDLEARRTEPDSPGPARWALIPPTARTSVRSGVALRADRKSTRLNSSHPSISYAVF